MYLINNTFYKIFLTGFCLSFTYPALAQDTSPYSSTLTGPLGLNTVPSARMDAPGTIRAGIGTLDPYTHGWLGVQLAKPLYINLRQTAETSSLNDNADHLYPGIDMKVQIANETRSRPAMVIGLQSAVGHKRMAGEYIALSKRYKDFDFTGGLGWGRFGSAGNIPNPFKSLSRHFGGKRALDGEDPATPNDWFTGETVGLFGGIEYFTPIKNLSAKFDWGADRYSAERIGTDFNAPAPWSFGLSWQPRPWINLSAAAQGNDKIMARLSLQSMLQNWRDRKNGYDDGAPVITKHLRGFRTGLALPAEMEVSARKNALILYDTRLDGPYSVRSTIALDPDISAPYQYGQAAINMSNHAGPAVEELTLRPTMLGLQGPAVHLLRADFERALTRHQGSPEEIWRNAEFDTGALEDKRLNRTIETQYRTASITLTLDNQLSLAEEDNGILYRTAFIADYRAPELFGFIDTFHALRVNIKDNLEHLHDYRPRVPLPVRSNVDDFADRTAALDKSFTAFTHSFRSNLHLSLLGGYLEEMYGGFGGELLYRPFGSRFAIGAESWQAFKRDPLTFLNLGFNGDHVLSGHLNAWYDLPRDDLTLHAKLGRYLSEDIGGTLGLLKRYENGVTLEGFITLTNNADYDVFGSTTNAASGLRLTLPLGGFKHMPSNAYVRVRAEPFGRDTGQAIENPLPLYELTEPFSYSHLARHWGDVVGE